ncbi:MAG TPA: Crp/Fnr family transcriptional regulator [Xanthobacteraceae bacterium]|nr:Crp/Fnr family transcriptional regulator [Xanthobacteraceae bacterium]
MGKHAASAVDTLLARIPYFAELDAATRSGLARAVRRRRCEAGEHILTENEPGEGLYFVVSGQVRLVKLSPDGREHVLRVLGPGATFNDTAVFAGGPSTDSAVAVGETVVGMMPQATMTALIERHPVVAKAGLKLLSARHRALAKVVEDLALRDVTTRVARLLLGCLGRAEHILEHAESACARITHQEIATMVGSVREVVQRALKELEREGAISLGRGRIHVRDVHKLERRAGG